MSVKAEPIRRILVPIDFSEGSEIAFQQAERLAVSTGATIVVLHAFELPDPWGVGGRIEEVDEKTKAKLRDIRSRVQGVNVECLAHGGPAGNVICWEAQENDIDLIVMGTHGRSGLSHLAMGSVAEYVMRHAPCPVLTVRQKKPNERPIEEPTVYVPMPPIM